MRCFYCKSKKLELDESSGMYFCTKCHRLLTVEEVDPKAHKRDLALQKEFETEVIDTSYITEAVPIQDEELGTFTLIMLGFLGGVPVFDFISTIMVEWSNVSDNYKRMTVGRFIARIFTIIIIVSLLMVGYKLYDIDYRAAVHDTVYSSADTVRTLFNRNNISPELVGKSLEQIERTKKYTPDLTEVEAPFKLEVKWSYLDKSIITGKTFLNIVEDTKAGGLAYLVQTRSIVEKFDETHYRNMGGIITAATRTGLNENYYYTGTLDTQFGVMQDDYNEYIVDPIDDMYSSKFIFFIKEQSQFRLNILRDANSNIVGFAVTELVNDSE